MINYVILRIHVDKKIIIPSHAILWQTSVSARHGVKKRKKSKTWNHWAKSANAPQCYPTPTSNNLLHICPKLEELEALLELSLKSLTSN